MISLEILLVVILLLSGVYYFNRTIVLSNRIKNAWSQIDVQLKKRADLVPNLVEAVKGYMKHEKQVFKQVTDARKEMLKAQTVEEKDKAGNMMASALKSILAIAENYPQLKANENFLMLQEELSGIENKIAYSRQFYNDSVLSYNNFVTTIPGIVFAKAMGKTEKPFLEIEKKDRELVKVDF